MQAIENREKLVQCVWEIISKIDSTKPIIRSKEEVRMLCDLMGQRYNTLQEFERYLYEYFAFKIKDVSQIITKLFESKFFKQIVGKKIHILSIKYRLYDVFAFLHKDDEKQRKWISQFVDSHILLEKSDLQFIKNAYELNEAKISDEEYDEFHHEIFEKWSKQDKQLLFSSHPIQKVQLKDNHTLLLDMIDDYKHLPQNSILKQIQRQMLLSFVKDNVKMRQYLIHEVPDLSQAKNDILRLQAHLRRWDEVLNRQCMNIVTSLRTEDNRQIYFEKLCNLKSIIFPIDILQLQRIINHTSRSFHHINNKPLIFLIGTNKDKLSNLAKDIQSKIQLDSKLNAITVQISTLNSSLSDIAYNYILKLLNNAQQIGVIISIQYSQFINSVKEITQINHIYRIFKHNIQNFDPVIIFTEQTNMQLVDMQNDLAEKITNYLQSQEKDVEMNDLLDIIKQNIKDKNNFVMTEGKKKLKQICKIIKKNPYKITKFEYSLSHSKLKDIDFFMGYQLKIFELYFRDKFYDQAKNHFKMLLKFQQLCPISIIQQQNKKISAIIEKKSSDLFQSFKKMAQQIAEGKGRQINREKFQENLIEIKLLQDHFNDYKQIQIIKIKNLVISIEEIIALKQVCYNPNQLNLRYKIIIQQFSAYRFIDIKNSLFTQLQQSTHGLIKSLQQNLKLKVHNKITEDIEKLAAIVTFVKLFNREHYLISYIEQFKIIFMNKINFIMADLQRFIKASSLYLNQQMISGANKQLQFLKGLQSLDISISVRLADSHRQIIGRCMMAIKNIQNSKMFAELQFDIIDDKNNLYCLKENIQIIKLFFKIKQVQTNLKSYLQNTKSLIAQKLQKRAELMSEQFDGLRLLNENSSLRKIKKIKKTYQMLIYLSTIVANNASETGKTLQNYIKKQFFLHIERQKQIISEMKRNINFQLNNNLKQLLHLRNIYSHYKILQIMDEQTIPSMINSLVTQVVDILLTPIRQFINDMSPSSLKNDISEIQLNRFQWVSSYYFKIEKFMNQDNQRDIKMEYTLQLEKINKIFDQFAQFIRQQTYNFINCQQLQIEGMKKLLKMIQVFNNKVHIISQLQKRQVDISIQKQKILNHFQKRYNRFQLAIENGLVSSDNKILFIHENLSQCKKYVQIQSMISFELLIEGKSFKQISIRMGKSEEKQVEALLKDKIPSQIKWQQIKTIDSYLIESDSPQDRNIANCMINKFDQLKILFLQKANRISKQFQQDPSIFSVNKQQIDFCIDTFQEIIYLYRNLRQLKYLNDKSKVQMINQQLRINGSLIMEVFYNTFEEIYNLLEQSQLIDIRDKVRKVGNLQDIIEQIFFDPNQEQKIAHEQYSKFIQNKIQQLKRKADLIDDQTVNQYGIIMLFEILYQLIVWIYQQQRSLKQGTQIDQQLIEKKQKEENCKIITTKYYINEEQKEYQTQIQIRQGKLQTLIQDKTKDKLNITQGSYQQIVKEISLMKQKIDKYQFIIEYIAKTTRQNNQLRKNNFYLQEEQKHSQQLLQYSRISVFNHSRIFKQNKDDLIETEQAQQMTEEYEQETF